MPRTTLSYQQLIINTFKHEKDFYFTVNILQFFFTDSMTSPYGVEPLLTDTSLIRTPPYYGQFPWSRTTDTKTRREQIHINLNSLLWTLSDNNSYSIQFPVCGYRSKLINCPHTIKVAFVFNQFIELLSPFIIEISYRQ